MYLLTALCFKYCIPNWIVLLMQFARRALRQRSIGHSIQWVRPVPAGSSSPYRARSGNPARFPSGEYCAPKAPYPLISEDTGLFLSFGAFTGFHYSLFLSSSFSTRFSVSKNRWVATAGPISGIPKMFQPHICRHEV